MEDSSSSLWGDADDLNINIDAFDMKKMCTVRIHAKDMLMDIRVVHAPQNCRWPWCFMLR